ncbi:hypothetical protein [Sphingomonas sp. MMS24-J13]|uniref:hypothetical protein n=1 Tax=Sphingomonas sp. MMS24-J13 TaxID=3238686 RepID=UPI00384C48CD
MLSRRLIVASLVLLGVAVTCIAVSDIAESRGSSLPSVSLPAPNFDVRMFGYASVSGDYELQVELPALSSAFDRVPAFNDRPLPCTISISTFTKDGRIEKARSTLVPMGSYAAGHVLLYRSASFQLRRGEFSIEIRNEGCTPPYQFQGGMAYLDHPKPVTISLFFVVRLLGYASGFLALLLLAYATTANLLRKKGP